MEEGRLAAYYEKAGVFHLHRLRVTLPHDRAYAYLVMLLLLVGPDRRVEYSLFQADYTKPLETVFTEFRIVIIDAAGHDFPLYYAVHENKVEKLPSWVPGWNKSTEIEKVINFQIMLNRNHNAGGPQDAANKITFKNDRMFISGLQITTVSETLVIPKTAPDHGDENSLMLD
jgi:hypothetical protein